MENPDPKFATIVLRKKKQLATQGENTFIETYQKKKKKKSC